MNKKLNTLARLSIAAGLLTLSAASCEEGGAGLTDGPSSPVVRISASVVDEADVQDPATKVDIDNSTGDFTWTAGDVIAVHSSDGVYSLFTLKSGAGAGSAVFENEFSGTRDNYAIYPSTVADAGNAGSTLKLTLPSTYPIDNGMGDWTGHYATWSPVPMIAGNSGDVDLSFKHVGGVFRLTFLNVPAATRYIDVTMDKNIAGSFTVNGKDTDAPYISNTDGSTKTVRFALSSALASQTGFTVNLPVPTGSYGSLQVVCKNSSGTSLSAATRDLSRSFTRAHGRKLSLDCSASSSRLYSFTLNNLTVDPGNAQAGAMTYAATNLSGTDVSGASGFTVSATTSDATVAEVFASGKVITVTGKKNGTATITATAQLGADRIMKTATVTVNALGTASISSDATQILLGRSITLTGNIAKVGGGTLTPDSYEWSITSGGELATLSNTTSQTATLTAGAEGTVTVQCVFTAGTLTKTATKNISILGLSITVPENGKWKFGDKHFAPGLYKKGTGIVWPFLAMDYYGDDDAVGQDGGFYFNSGESISGVSVSMSDYGITDSNTYGKPSIDDLWLMAAYTPREDRIFPTINGSRGYFSRVLVDLTGSAFAGKGLTKSDGTAYDGTNKTNYIVGILCYPDGAVINCSPLKSWNNKTFTDPIIAYDIIAVLIKEGCIFLPAVGGKITDGWIMGHSGHGGMYGSSTLQNGGNSMISMYFITSEFTTFSANVYSCYIPFVLCR